MPSELQRVAQGLVECLDQVPQIVARLQQTASRLRQQASWIADLSGSNPYGRQAALLLDDAARRCDEAAYRASLAPLKATVWAQTMVGGAYGATAAGASGSAGPGSPRGSGAAQRRKSGSAIAAEGASSRVTAAQAAVLLARLPKREERPGHREKTRGIWRDGLGREHELVSGVDDYRERADAFALAERLGDPPHMFLITSHVEIKFAMLMREKGLRDETIVINQHPCAGQTGCDEMLTDFLPDGARLTVYAPDGFKKTYRGRTTP